MDRKQLGSAVRRGILTGTVAGFVAGWSAFVAHSGSLDAAVQERSGEAEQDGGVAFTLPDPPGLPDLGAPARATAYGARTGPSEPLPRIVTPSAVRDSEDGEDPSGIAPDATALPGLPVTVAAPVSAPTAVAAPSRTAAPARTFAPVPTLPPAPKTPRPATRTSRP